MSSKNNLIPNGFFDQYGKELLINKKEKNLMIADLGSLDIHQEANTRDYYLSVLPHIVRTDLLIDEIFVSLEDVEALFKGANPLDLCCQKDQEYNEKLKRAKIILQAYQEIEKEKELTIETFNYLRELLKLPAIATSNYNNDVNESIENNFAKFSSQCSNSSECAFQGVNLYYALHRLRTYLNSNGELYRILIVWYFLTQQKYEYVKIGEAFKRQKDEARPGLLGYTKTEMNPTIFAKNTFKKLKEVLIKESLVNQLIEQSGLTFTSLERDTIRILLELEEKKSLHSKRCFELMHEEYDSHSRLVQSRIQSLLAKGLLEFNYSNRMKKLMSRSQKNKISPSERLDMADPNLMLAFKLKNY